MKLRTVCIFFIVFCAVCSMGFQCQKESFFPIPQYQFGDKVSLYPYKKVYNIGDTIWVKFEITSKVLFEGLTNQNIATDTTFLAMTFQYQKRFPVQFSPTDTFCYTMTSLGLNQGLRVLQEYRTYKFLNYITDCSQNFYLFKIGFIPKTVGIYSINGPGGDVIDCPNKVVKSPYSNIVFIFDLFDCNKDIYLSIPPASRGTSVKGQTEREIDNKKIFVFKVE